MATRSQADSGIFPSPGHSVLRGGIPRILNHDIMGCTAEGVSGNHLYSGRALGLSEPDDIIQLHPDLKSQWPHIRAHYERVGLDCTDRVIWDLDHDILARHPERQVSVFYFGVAEQAVRPDDDWFRVVDYINSKNNFVPLARELQVPIPDTRCFDDAARVDEQALADCACPCYVKAAVSVSGVGIYRCATHDELRDALTRFTPGTPVQIQAEVPSDLFLNLQYQSDENGYSRVAATAQVLDGPTHRGNRHPAGHEPWECVEPMAAWLHRQGMRGVYAFDVAVVDKPDGPEYLAIECNPRFNGASYPTAVAHRLGIDQWLAEAVATRHRSLAELDLSGLEYDPATGEGVILVNWGPILIGKLLCLIAGPPPVQERIALELDARL